MSEDSAKSLTPQPGDTLGHYMFHDRLGRGGMGEVFLAKDTRLDRNVAVKILPADLVADAERLARFRREAKTLAALNHPNIVTIYAVEEIRNRHFLVMELVEGKTLRGIIPEGGLSLERFFAVAVPLAEALAAAHERGIMHRDLKPENVMVTESGRLKVLDFGLAKFTQPREAQAGAAQSTNTLTENGLVLGTVPYMSPEQAEGRAVDHRSDIFSLGIILYEMLSGDRPFKGASLAALISAILRDMPASIAQVRPEVPRALSQIIRQCLEKAPEQRFPSAQDLHARLRDLQRELELEQALSTSQRRTLASMIRRQVGAIELSTGGLLRTKPGLLLTLAGVFGVNYAETAIESALAGRFGLGKSLGLHFARAAHALEAGLSFERHDVTNALAVYGFSFSYFFLLPILFFSTLVALARRKRLAPLRVFVLALTIGYLVSLPFFIFMPVPERWSFPDSEAILLSDLWTSKLIETFRPISGLDNCFPSFHTISTAVIALLAYRYRLRLRHVVLCLGLTVLLATFTLGIHWIADIAAGLAVAVLSVALAIRVDRFLAEMEGRA